MYEANQAQPLTWATTLPDVKPHRVRERKARSVPPKEAAIDIENAVTFWGDTVLRLALCKTNNRADAEDIAQTVFLKLCQRNPSFDCDEHLKAWLLRVTLTCTSDMRRSSWSRHYAPFNDPFDDTSETEGAAGHAIPRDMVPFCDSEPVLAESSVARMVAALPERQRIAIHLYYFEEYSTKEIAAIMGERPSTVRSHLHRARAALKTLIGGTHD